MIVTIGGKPGSGKTSVGKAVAEKIGFRFYSMGDIRGKFAMEKGMTIDELNKVAEKESWADTDFDEYTKKLGEKEDNFIIDSWLGFHFIPKSFKIFLDVEPGEAAKRIFRNQRPDEKRVDSPGELQKVIERRLSGDRERWKRLYGVDMLDKSNYDLVVDTTGMNKRQVIQKVLEEVKKRL